MKQELTTRSLRPFIGCRDFKESQAFYETIGFQIAPISYNMSLCTMGNCSFYLQDAFVKDWIDNTMLFLEVENPEKYLEHLRSLDLQDRFPTVKLKEMVELEWGKEFFLHDPSNILWHIGSFK